MKNDIWKAYARGLAAAMNGGFVAVPAGLLRVYRAVGLSDSDLLLFLQLISFRQLEQIVFPTPEQLAERLGTTAKAVSTQLRRLMKEGLLAIDEELDPVSGIPEERYNWDGLIVRCAEYLAEDTRQTVRAGAQRSSAAKSVDLFTVFEQEFGRPLSPMECETISAWLDQDHYSEELIRFALKESVFAGKLHFRYIDRILIEWSRNRVTNPEEAKEHARNFRGSRK